LRNEVGHLPKGRAHVGKRKEGDGALGGGEKTRLAKIKIMIPVDTRSRRLMRQRSEVQNPRRSERNLGRLKKENKSTQRC